MWNLLNAGKEGSKRATLVLKPKGDITRSQLQGYPPIILLKN